METYERGGWRWNGGQKPKSFYCYLSASGQIGVQIKNSFQCDYLFYCEANNYKIISFQEFIDTQLNWEEDKSIDNLSKIGLRVSHDNTAVKPFYNASCFSYTNLSTKLISNSLPNKLMSNVQKVRNALLPKSEKLLRKHGFKDDCGNWTELARNTFIEQQMNEDKDCFKELIKKLEDEEV